MTKDKLMLYTFIALLAITVVSAVLWSPVTTPSGWNLGLTVIVSALIAVGVAVGIDALFYKLVSDSPLNLMSAAVFGLIVALSYSLGLPAMLSPGSEMLPVQAPDAFIFIALISMVGMVLFKKLFGGKVNPAAAAKLLILLPLLNSVLIAKDHLTSGFFGYGIPSLAGPIGYDVIANNGVAPFSFASHIIGCFANPTVTGLATTPDNVLSLLLLTKFHGWVGGASSIAVIIAGVALFIVARRFIKWRITLAYFVSVGVMALLMATAYGDQNLLLRLMFSFFIGSSIFMAFFMATDPATTPLTYKGQLTFGVGLGVLTILIQTYMNFFGGAILALIIMNLFASKFDKIGLLKPRTEKKEPKLPKAKQFPAEKVKEYACMKCGACMRVCCHNLSPILLKQAFDKQDFDTLAKLHADYCTGCGHCTFVCPARIDLRRSILQAKGMLRQE